MLPTSTDMFKAKTQLRVRYAETDQMGYVYYGNYAMYFEVARVEAMRSVGFSYKEMEEDGILMPVLESYISYLKPGKYDELLSIHTQIQELPGVKIRFDYQISNEAGEQLTRGWTTLAFLKKDNHQPTRPPKKLMEVLAPFFT
jgi:acyl-CoA thioester hydrolase